MPSHNTVWGLSHTQILKGEIAMEPTPEELTASMPPATNTPTDVHELEEITYEYSD